MEVQAVWHGLGITFFAAAVSISAVVYLWKRI